MRLSTPPARCGSFAACNVPFNHYSLLRTIEDAWGLPELVFTSDHAQVTTMNEFLTH